MIRMLLNTIIILLISFPALAQDHPQLPDLKRPRYGVPQTPENPLFPPEKEQTTAAEEVQKPDNQRFTGVYKGSVTVHYKGKLVTADATLKISTSEEQGKAHYDTYIIPKSDEYIKYNWDLDGISVQRTVTIAQDTIYITDIIAYDSGGGNSQIRTLVFSEDSSAITFLKTEFDDAARDSATGHIIGRFEKLKQ